jgi:hypothetical protein
VAQVDPNQVAKAGVDEIQVAINELSIMLTKPAANIAAINGKINDLTAKQVALRTQALRVIVASEANRLAIAAMNNAAAALKTESMMIGNVATALNDAAKVISEAASLIAALAPFI